MTPCEGQNSEISSLRAGSLFLASPVLGTQTLFLTSLVLSTQTSEPAGRLGLGKKETLWRKRRTTKMVHVYALGAWNLDSKTKKESVIGEQ